MSGPVLLDTNVISELIKPRPDARVLAYVAQQTEPYLSVLTLHELHWGAERLADATRRARLLGWIAAVRGRFEARLIAIDADIAEHAGRLRAAAAAAGHAVEAIDALIAASAASRGATIATRNVRDFRPLGVAVDDPWRT